QVIAAARDISKLPASLKDASPLSLNPSASADHIKTAAEQAVAIHGRIDVLVNNAGYAQQGPVEELDIADIHAQFQTNLFGPLALIQALLPTFRARQSGHILNISSIVAFAGGPRFGAYNASKAALDAFTEALSVELAPYHVRALIVAPGHFPTNFVAATRATVREERESGAYTDRVQGYGAVDLALQMHLDQGQVGDVVKAAARMFEVVSGTGLAKDLVEAQGGKCEWTRVPLGPDCGTRMKAKLMLIAENVDAFEPIWSSTDVEKERLKTEAFVLH
ncbi:NAD-P-binding protein, partial [Amylostereum chailletii]